MSRLAGFAAAGIVGFVVDAGLLALFFAWLGPYGARAVSFSGAVLTTWVINRRFAFADRAAQVGKRHEFSRYVLAMIPGAAVNWLVYGMLTFLLPTGVVVSVLAAAVGSLAGMLTNFFTASRFAFRQR